MFRQVLECGCPLPLSSRIYWANSGVQMLFELRHSSSSLPLDSFS
jgi:hypothetical protein